MPPKLDLASISYEFWRNQLKSWQALTEIKKEKWGHLFIYHSCEQNCKKSYTQNVKMRTKTRGLEVVLKELDKK